MAALSTPVGTTSSVGENRAPVGDRLRSHLRFAARVVPLVALAAYAIHGRSGGVPADGKNAADALARALAAEGLDATADGVVWIDSPGGLGKTIEGRSRAVVRAKAKGEPLDDIFLVRARRSPEGVVLSIDSVHPLTKTANADEGKPVADGQWVAFTTTASGQITGIDLYDLSSEEQRGMEGWKKFQRFQNAITNLQKTGSTKGVQRRHYAIDPPLARAELEWRGHHLFATDAGHSIEIDPDVDDPIEGKDLARFERSVKAKPGDLITWSVDRVRAVSWLGPHFIEQLEYRAFKARDFLKQKFPDIFAENAEKEVQADLGGAKIKPTYTDPEIGWPPGPIKPVISPALPNEGVWLGTDDDPFVGKNPGVPGAFVQTFVRTDPQRAYARVYVTLWDPRQVALHMVAGTVEPVSATGEVGTGQIPRTPETLNRLVAGFNGGFQAIHFEGGMQVNGTMYLPPKPYAATVAELRDGTTAIGTWPDAQPDVPDDILSFRQNLVPIVKDGVVNPYKQIKWGGTPPGSADNIHTTRSGVCITKDGFVGYFFGNDMTPDTLGKGMVLAGCTQAVHLDMNAGHTGFEFYRVAQAGELPDLMRPLQSDWEAERDVPQLPGWSFRARRMIKGMPHMLFPRYIGRDGRDFMYLTLRAVLPGDPIVPHIQPAESNEGVWRTKGLPQHGFPYSLAMTTVRPDTKHPEIHARVLKIDPRTVKLATPPVDASQTVLTLSTATAGAAAPAASGSAHPAPKHEAATKSDTHLWLAPGSFAIGASSPGPSASALFDGESSAAAIASATALVGVTDEDGTLVLAIADAPSGLALKALLQQLGCSQVMVPPRSLDLRLGGSLDLSGELAKTPLTGSVVTLSRAQAPAARELFPQTPVVDPSVWQPLQARRVRYFGKKPVRPGQVSPPPSGSASSK